MQKVAFIGAGNMAYALAGAISRSFPDTEIIPFDISPERIELFRNSFPHVGAAESVSAAAEEADVCFLAVKPQVMDAALSELGNSRGLFVSIAAGLRLSYFSAKIPRARVVRVMPNTPCLAGEMAAGYSAGAGVTEEDLQFVTRLLESAGRAVKVDEPLLDAVTGVSGSGPAYFAYIAKAFAAAGEREGLPRNVAETLAVQTMKGTAALLEQQGLSFDELISMVSSPNGTTVAGREILESSDLYDVIARTVGRTAERSRELGK